MVTRACIARSKRWCSGKRVSAKECKAAHLSLKSPWLISVTHSLEHFVPLNASVVFLQVEVNLQMSLRHDRLSSSWVAPYPQGKEVCNMGMYLSRGTAQLESCCHAWCVCPRLPQPTGLVFCFSILQMCPVKFRVHSKTISEAAFLGDLLPLL